jgi:type IV pilus assembly protein PilC
MISETKFANWCIELSDSIEAGIGIMSHLDNIEGSNNKEARYDRKVKRNLEEGKSFSEAIIYPSKRNKIFYSSLIKTGEVSGNLSHALKDLGEYIEFREDVQRKVRSLIVITFIKLIALACFLAGSTYLLELVGKPDIDLIGLGFKGKAGALRMLEFSALGIIFLALVTYLAFYFSRFSFFEKIYSLIPFLGKALKNFALYRITYTMKLSMNSDMGIEESMKLIFDSSGSNAFQKHHKKVMMKIGQGQTLFESTYKIKWIPDNLKKAIKYGEQTGKLPDMAERLSDQFKRKANDTLESLIGIVKMMMKFLILIICFSAVGSIIWSVAVKPMIEVFKNF